VKFSIVTASFNTGRFLRDCIESVRVQQGVDWEHIVADGGSTDGTLDVLRAYPHLRWNSEPDGGISAGINKGFREATGEWVMWLNADDYLLPGALAKAAAFAHRHPEADAIYGSFDFVDAAGQRLKTSASFPVSRRMIVHYGPVIGSTACWYRKQTVMEEGYFLNENFRTNMDGEFYARLLTVGKKFAQMPDVLAAFRVHGENASQKHLRHEKNIDSWLQLERQWAEALAIRRAYGVTLFNHPIADSLVDAVLWTYYRWKKVALKAFTGGYRGRNYLVETT
jgi:glycosyltransferase involved in cell wall biosynthesis